jgi:AbrB family looped-hinge helix DNA binding protein
MVSKMAYEVKVTRQGQTTIPKSLREKYEIEEGDTILYIDVGDHITILPIPKDPLKVLAGLKVEEKGTVYEIRKEALKTAQRLVEEKFKRR